MASEQYTTASGLVPQAPEGQAPDGLPHNLSQETLARWSGDRSFVQCKAEFDDQGYVIFEDVFDAQQIAQVRHALAPHLNHLGRNNFEGHHTHRVYALLAKAPEVFAPMVTHPLALAFAEAELGPSFLLSACLAINTHPGETVQPWHRDDGAIQIPMPRPAYGVSAFWAIDDTTEENGATEIIPGSHLHAGSIDAVDLAAGDTFAGSIVAPDGDEFGKATPICLKSGSLMLSKGTLLHRGGANRSDKPRLIVTPQYCAGWARQLENMLLAVPANIAAQLPERVRELIGYNIHGAFMGYVDGRHPQRVLDRV